MTIPQVPVVNECDRVELRQASDNKLDNAKSIPRNGPEVKESFWISTELPYT